jgi:glycosyltransferase involved in cell wall biosynthesis
VVGRLPEERRAALVRELSSLNAEIAPSRVEVLGHVNDLAVTLRNCDGAIGAGRSALEALAGGRPVVLMGEGALLGLCTPETWPEALRTNLGDHTKEKDFQPALLETALRELLAAGSRQDLLSWGRGQVEKYYDAGRVAADVEKTYRWLLSRS